MTRRLSPTAALEFESLVRVLSVLAEELAQLAPQTSALLEAIDSVKSERNVRGARLVLPDLLAMTNATPVSHRRQIDTAPRTRANTSLDALNSKLLARIARVRTRGRITSEEQYYLIRERVEFLDAGSTEETSELWALLHAYEDRIGGAGAV